MVSEAVLTSSTIDQHREGDSGLTQERAFGLSETWAAALALAGVMALKIVYALVYRVDSDEPQHLHVVWGWAHGMVQYRDMFDNHSPLFQMACAPLLRMLGEHAWIMVPMRLAMLPLYVAGPLAHLSDRPGVVFSAVGSVDCDGGRVHSGVFPCDDGIPDGRPVDDILAGGVCLAVTGPMEGKRAFCLGLTIRGMFRGIDEDDAAAGLAMGVGAAGLLALHALVPAEDGSAGALKTRS